MTENGVTKVRFDLWVVLAFLFLSGISSFTFLYAEGKETKTKQQEVLQRLVRLESQYESIMKGIDKLTETTDKISEKLELHNRETNSNAVIKKWNDIK